MGTYMVNYGNKQGGKGNKGKWELNTQSNTRTMGTENTYQNKSLLTQNRGNKTGIVTITRYVVS